MDSGMIRILATCEGYDIYELVRGSTLVFCREYAGRSGIMWGGGLLPPFSLRFFGGLCYDRVKKSAEEVDT